MISFPFKGRSVSACFIGLPSPTSLHVLSRTVVVVQVYSAQGHPLEKRVGAEIWLTLFSPVHLPSPTLWVSACLEKGAPPIFTKVPFKPATAPLLACEGWGGEGIPSVFSFLCYYKVKFCDSSRSFPST